MLVMFYVCYVYGLACLVNVCLWFVVFSVCLYLSFVLDTNINFQITQVLIISGNELESVEELSLSLQEGG